MINKINPKVITPSLLTLCFLIVSSCGFHLRGDILLPEIYQTIYIDNQTESIISSRLRETLAENNITLVNSAKMASSIIRIYSHTIDRRAIAVRGKEVKEYEIKLGVSFSVHDTDGKIRKELQNVTNSRRYSFNNEQVLGSSNEEQILLDEMSIDIVNQIVRRLTKIR